MGENVMNKILVILSLSLLPLSLGSCNEEEDLTIYEGYVVDKILDEGYRYSTHVNGIIIWHTVPDRYYVVIYKDEQIAKHRVTEEFYNTFTVGSYVSLSQSVLEDENNEQ